MIVISKEDYRYFEDRRGKSRTGVKVEVESEEGGGYQGGKEGVVRYRTNIAKTQRGDIQDQ